MSAESSPMTRAVLALAEEADARVRQSVPSAGAEAIIAAGSHTIRVGDLRTAVATVLAADPEPRDAAIERMARAIYEAEPPVDPTLSFEQTVEREQAHFRRLAAAALDASRGGTQ